MLGLVIYDGVCSIRPFLLVLWREYLYSIGNLSLLRHRVAKLIYESGMSDVSFRNAFIR